MVCHRLLGQDEAASGRVLRVDSHPKERNGRERLHDTCGACRDDGHDTFDLIVERGNRGCVVAGQRALLIRKLVEFTLTDSATAWSAAFSWLFAWRLLSWLISPVSWEEPLPL